MQYMRRLLAIIIGVCASMAMLSGASRAESPQRDGELVFGIYPYLSPSQVVGLFAPVAEYLGAALGRTVTLRSAPDFGSFIDRTRAGEYDMIFTAPHMGRLAERRDGYRPLAQTGNPFIFVALVKKDSPVKSMAAMRGRSIAIGARLSMTYQVMARGLAKNGLELDKDVNFIDTAGFSNIIRAVIRGEADAGAAPTILLDNAPTDQRAQLREIYRSEPIPSFFLLGHPRLGDTTHRKLQKALFDFAKTPAGRAYFAKTLQLDFRPLDPATLKRMDTFTAVFDAP